MSPPPVLARATSLVNTTEASYCCAPLVLTDVPSKPTAALSTCRLVSASLAPIDPKRTVPLPAFSANACAPSTPARVMSPCTLVSLLSPFNCSAPLNTCAPTVVTALSMAAGPETVRLESAVDCPTPPAILTALPEFSASPNPPSMLPAMLSSPPATSEVSRVNPTAPT